MKELLKLYMKKRYNFFVPCLVFVVLVASAGNRDQWKNNGSAGLNGNAIERDEINRDRAYP